MKFEEHIYVTRPFLPSLEEFLPSLEQIWQNRVLTNNGPFHQELEQKLCEYLDVPFISLFANGTLALFTALQAMNIKGEVITTPFSFVATSHALWWNNIKPVFTDIDPVRLTLDPATIEAAITSETSAILPVHVYGNPCDVDAIENIARKHNLKVLYDAAHTFGAKYKGQSICSFGDMSVLSFHATKVFNTFEGGAIVCHDAETKKHIDHLKNFGIEDEVTVVAPGINAKMNEFQAAFGLLQLKYVDENIKKRRQIAELYREHLKNIKGLHMLNAPDHTDQNFAYFPVFIDEAEFGKSRDEVYETLKQHQIYGRRYFYPLISSFPPYRELPSAHQANLAVATQVSESVICLPMYPELETENIIHICKRIQSE